jgi:hypothetical protein
VLFVKYSLQIGIIKPKKNRYQYTTRKIFEPFFMHARMRIINHVIKLSTSATLDFIDVTDKIQKKVRASGIIKMG